MCATAMPIDSLKDFPYIFKTLKLLLTAANEKKRILKRDRPTNLTG